MSEPARCLFVQTDFGKRCATHDSWRDTCFDEKRCTYYEAYGNPEPVIAPQPTPEPPALRCDCGVVIYHDQTAGQFGGPQWRHRESNLIPCYNNDERLGVAHPAAPQGVGKLSPELGITCPNCDSRWNAVKPKGGVKGVGQTARELALEWWPRKGGEHETILTTDARVAEFAEVYNAALKSELQQARATFTEHTKAVGAFLSEMHATMIDPLADGETPVAEMCKLLLEAAREQRQQDYDLRAQTITLRAELQQAKTELHFARTANAELRSRLQEVERVRDQWQLAAELKHKVLDEVAEYIGYNGALASDGFITAIKQRIKEDSNAPRS